MGFARLLKTLGQPRLLYNTWGCCRFDILPISIQFSIYATLHLSHTDMAYQGGDQYWVLSPLYKTKSWSATAYLFSHQKMESNNKSRNIAPNCYTPSATLQRLLHFAWFFLYVNPIDHVKVFKTRLIRVNEWILGQLSAFILTSPKIFVKRTFVLLLYISFIFSY